MGAPSAGRRRYPSPLIKQDLAKLGKDAESRRTALISLRSVVEEHLDSNSLPRFLQQIEDSREGRRHVAPILEDLARAHGPSLAPHIPRLLHLLVHNLLASTGCPALLTACADAVASVARYCSGNEAEDVIRQVCLPLIALLPNKIPPLSTGAAVCLRSLVNSEQWRFAPATLVDGICWKAAMAAAAPPTQTVAHIHLLRALATANASAISKFAPPLLRLSLDILLTPDATSSWQLRLSAVHLLESLLKAADYTALATHLHPSLAALAKCRRHDKLPQVRNAVVQALQTAEALQKQQTKHSIKPESTIANHHRRLSDPFSSNPHIALPCQISPSPLTSPGRLNSQSARAPANNDPTEPDYYFPCFYKTEENASSRKIVHHIQEPHSISMKTAKPSDKPSLRINTRKPSPIRQVMVPSLQLPTEGQGHLTTESGNRFQSSNADSRIIHSARSEVRYVPEIEDCETSTVLSSATREIMVLGSNDELLASCERNLLATENCDHLGCDRMSSLRGQFAAAQFAADHSPVDSPLSPGKESQTVNKEEGRHQTDFSSKLDVEGDASAASVHLFNSLAQLATVDKCEQRSLPPAETPDHMTSEKEMLSHCPLTDFQNSTTVKHQSPAEPTDTEVETSSGEWSVRDNPIAEDHADDMAKQKDVNPWQHISTSLPGEIEKNWGREGAGLIKDSQSDGNDICRQANASEIPSVLAKNAYEHETDTHHSFVLEEYWTEIEEVRDHMPPQQSTWKLDTCKSSQVHNRLHLKLLLCAGLLVSVTMTILTMELQHHASAHYLPPT